MPTPETKFVQHLGRSYLVVAEFPNTEAGISNSNDYMSKHPKAGMLMVQDDKVLLSHCDDAGAGSGPSTLSPKAKRAIANYGAGVCLIAYQLNNAGNGANTIGHGFNLTTRQADSAIDAGRELAGNPNR